MYKKHIFIILISISLIGMLLWLLTLDNHEKQYIVKETYQYRSKIVFKTSSFEVDNILLPYVIEFIDEAILYNIDIDSLSRSFAGVYYDYPPLKIVGIVFNKTTTKDAYSLVSPLIGNFINKLRVIVFHELGHYYLNRKHCHRFCDEIMSTEVNRNSVYNNWQKQKVVMFQNIEHKPFKIIISKL